MVANKTIFYVMSLSILTFILITISGVLLPFILALVLGFLLVPIVNKIEGKISRTTSSAAIVVVMYLLAILALYLIVPMIVNAVKEIDSMFSDFGFIEQKIISFINNTFSIDLDRSYIVEFMKQNTSQIADYLKKAALSSATFSFKILNILSLLVVTPVVLFYVLRDWKNIIKETRRMIPRKDEKYIVSVTKKINAQLSALIRGQLMVCLSLGLVYGIGLSLVGLKLGFLIGFITGFLVLIPYIGMAIGAILAFGVALFQYPLNSFEPFLMIAGVFVFGQIVESLFLSPKLIGDAIGLHPLWILFALFVGGSLGGLIGILIALPLCAVVSVLAKEAHDYYIKTKLYRDKKDKEEENSK